MVNYQRWHQLKKVGSSEEDDALAYMCTHPFLYKRTKPKLFSLVLISLLSCCLILVPHLFCSSSAFSLLYSFGIEDEGLVDLNAFSCSSVPNGTICCDRNSIRSDICVMKGDVRTSSYASSIFLYVSRNTSSVISSLADEEELQHEKIRPYTRKWETSVMDTIDELDLISKNEASASNHHCDVRHDVPAVFFSTGGYTGNVYHEFNDGILPLFITAEHLKKKVVLVALEYHDWWITKYENILSHLSDYPVIDFSGDKRTHCFPEAIVGLRIHDELTVDHSMMQTNTTIVDFHDLLDRAYRPRVRSMIEQKKQEAQEKLKQKGSSVFPSETLVESRKESREVRLKRPKLVIISRNGSRAITNEDFLVKMAEKTGFRVQVLRPEKTTELARIYWALNTSDVMIGVHGAAMTHFLFMRPGSVFIQVIPLGTDWAADSYYGDPARKLGLKYVGYHILPRESSLFEKYGRDDPIIRDPESVNSKGWQYTKSIYLDSQKVRLNLRRFQKRLDRAYHYSITRKHHQALPSLSNS